MSEWQNDHTLDQRILDAIADCDAGRVYKTHRLLGFWITERGPDWPVDDPDRPRRWGLLFTPPGFRWMLRVIRHRPKTQQRKDVA